MIWRSSSSCNWRMYSYLWDSYARPISTTNGVAWKNVPLFWLHIISTNRHKNVKIEGARQKHTKTIPPKHRGPSRPDQTHHTCAKQAFRCRRAKLLSERHVVHTLRELCSAITKPTFATTRSCRSTSCRASLIAKLHQHFVMILSIRFCMIFLDKTAHFFLYKNRDFRLFSLFWWNSQGYHFHKCLIFENLS